MGRGGQDAVMSVEVRGRARLGGLLSRLSEPRECRVAAASRAGLLRRLRPAPSANRHAVVLRPDLDYVMVAALAGHGPHGAALAELAADTLTDVLERRLLAPPARARYEPGSPLTASPVPSPSVSGDSDGGSSGMLPALRRRSSSGSAAPRDADGCGAPLFPVSVELAMQDAFVEASMAVDATPHARHSGTTATVAVLRAGELVVGSVGDGAVLLGRRRAGVVALQRLHGAHRVGADARERERVERFGGVIHAGSGYVSDGGASRALAVTRALGDTELRKAGVCQLPQIGSMRMTHRDAVVAVTTAPLWSEADVLAPQELSDVVNAEKAHGPSRVSTRLLDVAFGPAGPAADATLVCMLLKR